MSLPSSITPVAGKPGVYSHADGHRLINCSNIQKIVALGAAYFHFSDGTYEIVGGANLDDCLVGVDLTSSINSLAANYTRRQVVAFTRGVRGRVGVDEFRVLPTMQSHGDWYFENQRPPFRNLTHVFGLEISPFVHAVHVVGGGITTVSSLAYGLLGNRIVRSDTDLDTGSYAIGGGAIDTVATLGTSNTVILKLPIGKTWGDFVENVIANTDEGGRSEVRTKIVEAWNSISTHVFARASIPCIPVAIRFANGVWKAVTPNPYDHSVTSNNWWSDTGLGIPAFTRNKKIVVPADIPVSSGNFTINLTEVGSIDGRDIRNLTRGLFFGAVQEGGSDVLSSALRSALASATVADSSDLIPSRPNVDGIPMTDDLYAGVIEQLADSRDDGQIYNKARLPCVCGHFLTPLHVAVMIGNKLNPGKYKFHNVMQVEPWQLGYAVSEVLRDKLHMIPSPDRPNTRYVGMDNPSWDSVISQYSPA